MSWFSLLINAIKILSKLLSFIERNQLITEGERKERARRLEQTLQDVATDAQVRRELKNKDTDELIGDRGWWRK